MTNNNFEGYKIIQHIKEDGSVLLEIWQDVLNDTKKENLANQRWELIKSWKEKNDKWNKEPPNDHQDRYTRSSK